MDPRERLNFRIDSFTPDTLPMARLAQYLAHLSILYGNDDSVHFEKLRKGSAIVQVTIEEPAFPKVFQRLQSVKTGDPDPEVQKAFRSIDRLLRADNAVGTITRSGKAKILEFPGRKLPVVDPITIFQPTTVDGVVIRIGGRDETIPVTVRDLEGKVLNCEIRGVSQAKDLSRHFLAETLRLSGNGKWSRTSAGTWELESLVIQSFEVVDEAGLDEVVEALRAVKNNAWTEIDDPVGAWKKIRGVDDSL
ncbi:hypothetical protein WJ32_18010 [Burkholderia ubonensis]|uniref:Uncharacterized protein n=1 Tax=Burkholderia ubonensis TaxID=101571 RepID=A0A118HXB0_9BURK|nr:hypothetical protein [Burkholderia ubonensis]AOJ64185.1 hypothetical protein WJ32_18010 [Burkholderia ubonensis]KVG73218.1 hypothetical protein WJ33_16710 [Burkholderia ubonensis]